MGKMKAVQVDWRKFPLALAKFGMVFFGLFTIGAFFERLHYLPYDMGWFRPQYLLGLIICLGITLCYRAWKSTAVIALLAAMNLFYVAPYLVPLSRAQAAASEGTRIRICQLNVNFGNQSYARTADYIRSHNPDVVLIEELTDEWAKAIARELPEYRYGVIATRQDPFGIGVFSRIPTEKNETRYLANYVYPANVCDFALNSTKLRLVHVHALPTISATFYDAHCKQLADLAKMLNSEGTSLIVSGDFNSPAWSGLMQSIMANGKLHSAASSHGWKPTWPTAFRQAGVGIDHCLVDDKVQADSFEVGPDVGSDHYPLCIDILVRN